MGVERRKGFIFNILFGFRERNNKQHSGSVNQPDRKERYFGKMIVH
jgi:hypothetical protein